MGHQRDACARVPSQPHHAEFLHVKPGKGAAFVRSKLKNYLTGNTVEKTFRAGEMVDTAVVERKDSEFTYVDGAEVRVCERMQVHTRCAWLT